MLGRRCRSLHHLEEEELDLWKGLARSSIDITVTDLCFLVRPTARPITSASRQRKMTHIEMSKPRRLMPRYRLCGGSMRSRRSESVHRVEAEPKPIPSPLRFVAPSSGTSQSGPLYALPRVGSGAFTSFALTSCALIVSFTLRSRCVDVNYIRCEELKGYHWITT